MKAEIRRKEILKKLSESDVPISAKSLSLQFGVSRQIIVKDISHLRADNVPITSLTKGYVLSRNTMPERVFKILHSDEDVETELNMIVDLGGTIKDVFIYHKVYNKVSARLDIKSRHDVKNFLEKIASGKSSLLKNVTSGYHYHTISADSAETLNLIENRLKKAGFLAALQEYEPDGENA